MAKPGKADVNPDDARRFVTPEFRASYPHLFKAVKVMGKGEPKFSITMLLKKSIDLSKFKLAMKHAKIDEFGPDKDQWPEIESPVADGDSPKYADKEGYKGCWVVKAISSEAFQPAVVDEGLEPIINQKDFYPGCYAEAQVYARVWEFGGKHGVHFILDMVHKTRDGKPFSSRKSAGEVFKPITNTKAHLQHENDEDDGDSEDFET